jgi:hypothetical protein
VIANEHVNLASRRFRLGSQPENKVENLTTLIASADYVAHLNDNEIAADPFVIIVYRSGELKSRSGGVNIRMNVTNYNYSIWG